MNGISIPSTMDGTDQPALFWAPAGADADRKGPPVPLAVCLHTWSQDYKPSAWTDAYLAECERRGWAMVNPNFRGPNNRPEACASDLAVQDVLDAVDYARRRLRVDEKRIYILGVSGGGHMTMMMAGKAPKLWAAASAWVGISDIAAWHEQTSGAGRKGYADMVERVCGGPPGASAEIDDQYLRRSPKSVLDRAAGLPVDINAGIHDGHSGSVPISQSLNAFNILARANGHEQAVVGDDQIDHMVRTETAPAGLAEPCPNEPERAHKILFRRTAGPARVTIFEGGHEIDIPAAFAWLKTKGRKP